VCRDRGGQRRGGQRRGRGEGLECVGEMVFGHESVAKSVEEERGRGRGERMEEESAEAIGNKGGERLEMIDIEETAG
jgi:hypothetical protein